MRPDLTFAEQRVLGCLLEKQRTTPDQYPLSLNALRLACNQSTNREPVVDFDDDMIRGALHGLGRRRWTRLASGHTSRASKYRHLLDDALSIDRADQAVLAILLLRGPQTPGELKGRTERLHPFATLDEVEARLGSLIDRGLVARLERRAGQKEVRYAHLLGEEAPADAPRPPSRRLPHRCPPSRRPRPATGCTSGWPPSRTRSRRCARSWPPCGPSSAPSQRYHRPSPSGLWTAARRLVAADEVLRLVAFACGSSQAWRT